MSEAVRDCVWVDSEPRFFLGVSAIASEMHSSEANARNRMQNRVFMATFCLKMLKVICLYVPTSR